MHVTENTLQRALFNILRKQEFVAYSTLRFKRLQKLWAGTGLRQNDLRDILRMLFEKDHLDFQNDGQGLAVILTQQGFEHMHTHGPHWGDLIASARDRYTLFQIAQRTCANTKTDSSSRKNDQAMAA